MCEKRRFREHWLEIADAGRIQTGNQPRRTVEASPGLSRKSIVIVLSYFQAVMKPFRL